MGFKSADDTFGYIAVMEIWKDKLESAVPLVNNGATIFGDRLIIEDLKINAVALGFEARNDAILGSNTMPVVA